MPKKITPEVLHRTWVHSHEEDTDREMVFRPETFKFPPSRGRASFELKPDGSLVEGGPGPDDRREARAGSWKLEGADTLAFYGPSQPGPSRLLRIRSASADRLVIMK
jgi:hypothetical protein